MIQITKELIEKAKLLSLDEYAKAKREMYSRRLDCGGLIEEDFMNLLVTECNKQLAMRGSCRIFEIDKNNELCIKQLYYYLLGSQNFRGSLGKGIFIMGNLGTGKTILIRGFCGVIERLQNIIFSFFNAYDLARQITSNGIEPYAKKPMIIDDIGKEPSFVKDFGTDTTPVRELIAIRYDNGALTFATSNYKIDTLTKKYGEQTVERIMEMFTPLELVGQSRRT